MPGRVGGFKMEESQRVKLCYAGCSHIRQFSRLLASSCATLSSMEVSVGVKPTRPF